MNTNLFKSLVSNPSGFTTADDVGMAVSVDARAALLGLCEVLARQTEDERVTKGTAHKNKFGFSKREVTRGTYLATKFMNDENSITIDEMTEACALAKRYRNQLWMITLGAVPVNNLNLRPSLVASQE
ncbi:MAG: hypothetical protein E6R04_01915 [Spirochaetes bacterium]|nr:MAG: hypothetical protein E6R04_01915 [Spirochaetota bacterium]